MLDPARMRRRSQEAPPSPQLALFEAAGAAAPPRPAAAAARTRARVNAVRAIDARRHAASSHQPAELRFAVLASSSAGNCSVLIHGTGENHRLTLIDCGLSPRRTRQLLARLGLRFDAIDDIVLTHLDRDHAHAGWASALPPHARFRIARAHRGRASRDGLLRRRTEIFDAEPFSLSRGVVVTPTFLAHDELGVAAFRFDAPGVDGGDDASLAYATDLGRATPELIDLCMGVDTLAIESNYCPEMQLASDRPAFLIDRIMNGSGHLSNQECFDAASAIMPRRRAVLLHLSRQCNTPERAAAEHANMPWETVVAQHDRPTPILDVVTRGAAPAARAAAG